MWLYGDFFCRDITDDEAFVDELRVTLRFFAAVLVRRTQKVTRYALYSVKVMGCFLLWIMLIELFSISGGCGVPHYTKASQGFHETHWNNKQSQAERYNTYRTLLFYFGLLLKKTK